MEGRRQEAAKPGRAFSGKTKGPIELQGRWHKGSVGASSAAVEETSWGREMAEPKEEAKPVRSPSPESRQSSDGALLASLL